jgi:SIR2-like domain
MDEHIKNQLENILRKFDTLPFLFVGSGLSRRYLDTPNWEGLLQEYASIAKKSEFGYQLYLEEVKEYETPVGKNPKLATLIERDFNRLWLTDEKYELARNLHKEKIQAGISPFKLDIAQNLIKKQEKMVEDYEGEIKMFKQLGNNHIAGIITTNYDTFLESCFKDYSIYIGQNELIFSAIQGIAEIYKIHGCVTKPDTIVINEEDYLEYVNKNAYLAAKILTIFLEHPIIFIGYSINDSNIEEILNSIVACLNNEQLEKLKDRFLFVEWNNTDQEDTIKTFQKSFQSGKRIEMTYIYIKDYGALYKLLTNVKAKYKASVLRKLKSEIYELVLTNEPSEKLKVVNIDDNKLENIEVVVGVGVIKNFAEKGYEGITVQEIYEDVVFNDKNFDSTLIVEKSLPTLLKRHSNSIPIYKYIRKYEGVLSEQIAKEIKKDLNSFLNRNLIQRKQTFNLEERSVREIVEKYELEKALEYICFLNKEEMDLKELKQFLEDTFKQNPDILKDKRIATNFRRVVKIFDWLKYAN